MKQRIQELYEQSQIGYGLGYDMEKFAELIVNDVLNIVAISGEQCNCSTLFRNISDHFGVTQ